MKPFSEALIDGYQHVTDIADEVIRKQLRDEGIRIDDEGYYTFIFGSQNEYSLSVEPLPSDGQYRIVLRKGQVIITEPLAVWSHENDNK